MGIERQLLPRVQMHGRGNSDVRDRGRIARQPRALGQARIEDAGELVEHRILRGDDGRVRRCPSTGFTQFSTR